MTEISVVRNATSTRTHTFAVGRALDAIGNGTLRILTETYRCALKGMWLAIKRGDMVRARAVKDAAKGLKCDLPNAIFGGTFSSRKRDGMLIKLSGGMCVDIDDLGYGITEAEERVWASPYAFACYRSATGDGLKVLLAIEDETKRNRRLSFQDAQHYFSETLGLIIDPTKGGNAKDTAFLCDDPNILINWDASTLPKWEGARMPEPRKEPPCSNQSPLTAEKVKELLECIDPPSSGERMKWKKVVTGVSKSGVSRAEGIGLLKVWDPEWPGASYQAEWDRPLDDVSVGTLVYYAREEGGWDGSLCDEIEDAIFGEMDHTIFGAQEIEEITT